jgi:glycosyltransferase involved in cell wall biosynthesis
MDCALTSPLIGSESESLVPEGAGDEHLAASVIVPVHGNPEWARLCFASLVRQDIAAPYEVIAVFDHKGDYVEEIAADVPRLRHCFCRPEHGPGGARNRAIEVARGDYLAFTDEDCLAEKDWLRRIVEACRRRDGGPVRGWVETAYPHSYIARAFNTAERGTARPEKCCNAPGTGGNNMAVSRLLVQRSHARFAERVYGAEEIAFLHELPADRRTVLMDPAANVRHLRSETLHTSLARHYRMGWGSGWLRRRSPMRGSFFAHHVWLAPLLVPARFLLTFSRVARLSPGLMLDFLRLSPFVACQYLCYTVGFVSGAVSACRAGATDSPASEG